MTLETDLVPGVIAYSSAISACEGKQALRRQALGLLLVAGGCNPPFSLQGKGRVAPPQGHSTWSQQALVLLEAMQEEGLVPNVISYNAAISAREHDRQGSWHLAFWR